MKQPEQISECSRYAWTFLFVFPGFSYHRTEGQEMSTLCVVGEQKAFVSNRLLLNQLMC